MGAPSPQLIAVSGGLDSIALLWVVLTRSDDPIHVHHVQMRGPRGRWEAERAAIETCLPLIREATRPFSYSESIFMLKENPARYDVTIVSTECAKACKRLGIRPSLYARGGAAHDEKRSGIKRRRELAAQAWVKGWKPDPAPPVVFPISTMTRSEMWAMLPKDIREATWSCRRPKPGFAPCGGCHTCRELKAEGVPPARRFAHV